MTAADVRLDHLALARDYAAAPELWPVAPRFNPTSRWYHRIAAEEQFEVWLLTWLPGQSTDLHDHGGSSGAFHLFSGSLIEDTYVDGPDRPGGGLIARELGEGAGRRFGARHIHRVANRSGRPAISVHVYSPALTTMTRYRIGAPGLEVVSLEQAGVQW